MTRILYPATANFGRGKDKKKRKKRGLKDAAVKAAIPLGVIGAAKGAITEGYDMHRYLKNDPRLSQYPTQIKAMAIGLNAGEGALRKGVKYGLIGAGLGAGLYGAKKLMDKYKKRGR